MPLTTPQMIEHYRLVLLRLVGGLFVMAGLEPGTGVVDALPRSVKYAILKVLRQAEAAERRLIFAKAKGLDVPDYVAPPKREKSTAKSSGEKKSRAPRIPQFQLIDPRKFLEELYPNRKARRALAKAKSRESKLLVRIDGFDGRPAFEEWSEAQPDPSPDDLLTAKQICRRMQALYHALNDMPAQVQRMLREIAKRKAAKPGPGSVPPLRYGLPPGHRKRHIHAVDQVLYECGCLARREEKPPDKVAATA